MERWGSPFALISITTIYAPGGKVLASAKSLFGHEIIYAEIPIGIDS